MDVSTERKPGVPEASEFSLHALEYHWDEFEPHLACFDMSMQEEVEFDLEEVDFAVSRNKVCIGSWDGEGRYRKCPTQAPVAKFVQCHECSEEFFIPDQECVFEPKCDGTNCQGQKRDWEFCKREHVVYVAFYDTRMKVGMSSSRRVAKRLIEQGADAYSIVGAYPNRKSARDAEKEISERLRIPQFYNQEVLLRNLSRPLDARGIEGRLEALRMTLRGRFDLEPEPLTWLSGYPIELPLQHVPELQTTHGRHRGQLVGIKGKWMVFESEGLQALNLSDLPGRFMARHVA